MLLKLQNTSRSDDSAELNRKSLASPNHRKPGTRLKRSRCSSSSRKRRKVDSIPVDSNCNSLGVSTPVTVKTWIKVASDVETYRKLVEAGAETSTTLANEFQRLFIEYFKRIQKYEGSGTKLHRRKLKVGKMNQVRSSKKKRKYKHKVHKLGPTEKSKSDPGSAQLKFWVMEVLSEDAMQRLAVTHWALRNHAQSGLLNHKESRRLKFVDECKSTAANESADVLLLKSKFRPLTHIEKKIARETMRLPASRVVQTRFGINMCVRHLKCLLPEVWLNDEVVNFWLGLVQERSHKRASCTKYPEKHKAKVFIMNSFFWTRLHNTGVYTYKNVRRWTKKSKLMRIGLETIFDLDKFLIPVHITNTHWCAGVINFKKKRIEYYDSLGRGNEKFFKFFRRYLLDECRDKKGMEFCLDGFQDFFPRDAPQQGNGSDCGVFMLKYLEWACECRDPRGPDGFSQENMGYFRRRMLVEIIQSKLLEE